MTGLYRRRLLQIGAALGISGAVSSAVSADDDHGGHGSVDHSSPELEKYVQSLPIPEEREADGRLKGAEYHNISIEETTHEFHPDLGETTIWGYDGQFPGPILSAQQNQPLAVEVDNSGLPEEHLFEVDERVDGTTTENYVDYDDDVPEVRNSTHFHGLNIDPESDGQADMWISPDGEEGPRRTRDVQEVPNEQSRLTSTYHDHTRGITRLNNYAGLVGPYYISHPSENRLRLPDGEHDIPLVIADRYFDEDGELFYPGMFMADVGGDVATVNGAAWPKIEVEPRRYRFRIINVSNARTFDLGLEDDDDDGHMHSEDMGDMDDVPTLYQISPGHGYLDEVVEIGHMGDIHSLLMAPFERADVIVDFSDFAGQTFTVTNHAEFPYAAGMDMDHDHDHDHDHDDGMEGMTTTMEEDDGHPQIHEIMQIEVADEAEGPDTTVHPTELTLPEQDRLDPDEAHNIREITMGMEMDDNELMVHHLNDNRWGDPVEIKPEHGSTELWDLVNDDHHTHPIHLHLVEFEVVARKQHHPHDLPTYEDEEDAIEASYDLGLEGRTHSMGEHYAPGETHDEYEEAFMDHYDPEWEDPLPNEKGGKDVVRVDPGETVRIAVEFDREGMYPYHCHVLEHEDHDMMRPFMVVPNDDGDSENSTADEKSSGRSGDGPGNVDRRHV